MTDSNGNIYHGSNNNIPFDSRNYSARRVCDSNEIEITRTFETNVLENIYVLLKRRLRVKNKIMSTVF